MNEVSLSSTADEWFLDFWLFHTHGCSNKDDHAKQQYQPTVHSVISTSFRADTRNERRENTEADNRQINILHSGNTNPLWDHS